MLALDVPPRGPCNLAPPGVELGLAALLVVGAIVLVLRRRRR